MATLGLLASYRSGLSVLRKSGQDQRFISYYLKNYVKHFERVYYFSYSQDQLETFTNDPDILKRVTVISKPVGMPDWKFALGLSVIKRHEFKSCDVFRVFQSLGIFPMILPWLIWQTPSSLCTFGYKYAEFARIEKKPFWNVSVTLLVEWLACRIATVMLVTTSELFQYIQPQRGLRPIALVPNGVDPDQFERKSASMSGHSSVRTLLFVGRLEKQKNLHTLVQAAAEVQRVYPLRLLWIGQGSLEGELRAQAKDLNVTLDIIPSISHEQLPVYMHQADLFTLLSWAEGHPKVLLEAMAAGLACVVSDSDGNRSLVQQGVTGYLCRPEDLKQVVLTLKDALKDPGKANVIGRNAADFIRQHFNIHHMLSREISVLSRLADDPHAFDIDRTGLGFRRWLGYSCRRRLLDQDLARLSDRLTGDVLEIGGGKTIRRGRFLRPWWQTETWTTLNKSEDAKPDIVADAQAIPRPNDAVDCVYCLETLEYVEEPNKALREMYRVLRRRGTLILSIPFAHAKDQPHDRWRFTGAEIEKLLHSAGFRVEEIRPQGARLSGWAHQLKSLASRSPSGWVRLIGAAVLVIPVELLMMLDQWLQSFITDSARPTGFLAIATKDAL